MTQDNLHRPMDLRAATKLASSVVDTTPRPSGWKADESAAWRLNLAVGSQIAAEARSAVKVFSSFMPSLCVSVVS